MKADRARRPTFIIGGAPRSGTTLLCHLLERHPDVYIIRPYIPEPKVFVVPAAGGGGEYLRRYAQAFAGAGSARALGEKTSYYLENDEAAGRIAATLGQVRMLFIVREPVQRAYSNYLWSLKNGIETLSFDEALRLEGARPNPLGEARAYARPFDYLIRGDYATFAERYFARFGRACVKFVLYEDLERRPTGIMQEIQTFIGVDPLPMDAQSLGRINAARETGAPLNGALEASLRERMAPLVHRFAGVSGLDVSPWGY
ncbi:MAG: sulfotransferase family protein [Vicinamibacterales bacterium]